MFKETEIYLLQCTECQEVVDERYYSEEDAVTSKPCECCGADTFEIVSEFVME